MTGSPVFVGCDLGTTGSKAAVVDEEGTILGDAYEEVPLVRPRAGWVEQDPLAIEASAHRVIGRALSASGRVGDVAGVAFSGQMSGIGTIDAEFEPVTRYDSWLDTRCEPYIERMADAADRVVELAGCPPTYAHGPKILWWRDEHPETYARVHRFVPIGSFVAGRAAGLRGDDAFVDHTHLHFSNLADTRAGTWSDELLETFGVAREVLPRVVAPTDVVGTVSPAVAEASGLPAGTPVAAGAGDTTAASLGAGAVVPGRAFDVAGTASVLAICLADFHPDRERHTLMATRGIVPGTFLNLAFINGGGLAPPWFRDEIAALAGADAYDRLADQAAEVPEGSDGLLWYPHLQGRVLPPSPHARGAWVGLTSRHGRGHLYRAILEGIAFEYAEWARLAAAAGGGAPSEARALGGGAASALWNQIKADMLGISWVPTAIQEAGVLGDALIAAAATGHAGDMVETIGRWQSTGAPVRPRPDAHETYRRLQPVHRAMGEALAPVFDRLEEAR